MQLQLAAVAAAVAASSTFALRSIMLHCHSPPPHALHCLPRLFAVLCDFQLAQLARPIESFNWAQNSTRRRPEGINQAINQKKKADEEEVAEEEKE